MGRFKDNTTKNPPVDADIVPGWDSAGTDADVKFTLGNLAAYVLAKLTAATDAAAGLLSAALYTKLNTAYTNAQVDAANAKLAEQPISFLITTPADGFMEIFRNPLSVALTLDVMLSKLNAGTLTLTIKIDGTAVTGFNNVPVSTTWQGSVASALLTLPVGATLGVEIADTTTASGLQVSIRAHRVLS
jgi:hypothetical protein